jgi:hypothetical protein
MEKKNFQRKTELVDNENTIKDQILFFLLFIIALFPLSKEMPICQFVDLIQPLSTFSVSSKKAWSTMMFLRILVHLMLFFRNQTLCGTALRVIGAKGGCEGKYIQ